MRRSLAHVALVCAVALPAVAAAAPPDYLHALHAAARAADPAFTGFSAARGQAWFDARHGGEWSCSTCHTSDPLAPGRHAVTGRSIAPLAPAANPERLTDPGRRTVLRGGPRTRALPTPTSSSKAAIP
jgi:hypothetical protein